MMGRIDAVPLRLVRTIGVLAVLGALGLILPPLTGIAKALALAAAAGPVPDPGRRDFSSPQPERGKADRAERRSARPGGRRDLASTVWL
jgi:hypothetical protein